MKQNVTKDSYATVSAEEFSDLLKSNNTFLLDVRTPDEFKEGHIEGAYNLDVNAPDFLTRAKETLPKDKTIAVYCLAGKREAKASDELFPDGYKIVDLEGGIEGWIKAGYPTVKN